MLSILFLRGTTAQNDAYTGPLGTITLDTEKKKFRIHDGSTQGGVETVAADDIDGVLNAIESLGITDIDGLSEALNNLDSSKVDKISGKGLSTNDFTNALQTKLNNISAGAEVNQNAYSAFSVSGQSTVNANGKTAAITFNGTGGMTITTSAIGQSITFDSSHDHEGVYQPSSVRLDALAALSGTSGIVRKNGSNGFTLDTGTYLTSNQTITFSGDVSGSGSTTVSLSLNNTGVSASNYGDSVNVPTFTVDAKGRLTNAGNVAIRSGTTSVTGLVRLSTATNSTSTTLAATPSAVKQAYDLAADAVPSSEKGQANGVATLDSSGLVPASQLPSYVEEVLEYANLAALPAEGESGKIYITLDTDWVYRWSGSTYVRIGSEVASADSAGKLSSARTITMTGDGTWSVNFDGSGNVSAAMALTNSGVSSGSYGSSIAIPSFTVDSKGRLTAAGTNNVRSASTSTTGVVQLNNTLTSTSTALALTAAQGKVLQDSKVDKETGKGLSANDFTDTLLGKLNGIEAGAEVNVGTNLGTTGNTTTRTITSSTGSNVTIPLASASAAGVMSSAMFTKLDGVATGATANTGTVTQVTGGDGLTGSITESGSLSVDSTVVRTNDSRLTNSREWTASTVSQAEAEAGTATTRRAWTAQRIRQAIAAWWSTITLTKTDVGLGNVDNTADGDKSVFSAGRLTTGRTINGTSFNGTANITTSSWGTSRTLTVGGTGKSVNGSGNVSWTLAEIGAAAASHTHSAADITSGTMATARLPAAALIGDTTYSDGDGLALSGTTFSVVGNTGITANSNGVSLTAITAGNATVGALRYNSTTRVAGQMYGGTTAPTGTTRLNYAGNYWATNLYAVTDVFAGASDIRLKENIVPLYDALGKVCQLETFTHSWNETAQTLGGFDQTKRTVGFSAQDLQKVLPEVVSQAPFDLGEDGESKSGEDYLTVQYDKVTPLLAAAIKELNEKHNKEVGELKDEIAHLKQLVNDLIGRES